MPAELPMALPVRFREYVGERLSGRAAAVRLKLSVATAVRWLRRLREQGDIRPGAQGRPKGHGKLAPYGALLEELVAQDGDITLLELARTLKAATGVVAHSASIGRFFEQAWLLVQKKSLVATERLRACVKKRRLDWFRHYVAAIQAHPDRLFFIDETSVKTNLTPQYRRSLCGSRLEMNAPFGAWGTQTFIAGLSHDNLRAQWIFKCAMDGEAFEAYVRNVLVPELRPGTVVICDNLATHYDKAATKALRDIGCWFVYLRPYSPDLNPIEMAFSKHKAHLRRIEARTFDQMFNSLAKNL